MVQNKINKKAGDEERPEEREKNDGDDALVRRWLEFREKMKEAHTTLGGWFNVAAFFIATLYHVFWFEGKRLAAGGA